jgi:hypothetical protein
MVHDEAEQVEHEAMVLDQLRQKLGTDLPKGIVAKIRANEGEPVATKDAPLSELDSIPVIAADDVGAYVNALEKGIDITDLVASMAPPFDQFFIEFQRVPNQWGLYA